MGDVLSREGDFLPWTDIHPGGGDRMKEKTYTTLLSNLLSVPIIDDTRGPHQIFFEEGGNQRSILVWQYEVPPLETSSCWRRIAEIFNHVKAFRVRDGILYSPVLILPPAEATAHRVLLRLSAGRGGRNSLYGHWNAESDFLEQYRWQDGLPLLNTSMAQLYKLQTMHPR